MMKKTCIRGLSVCLVLVVLGTALVSCGGKLSGTYENNTFGLVTTYTFSGNKYTRTMIGLSVYDTGLTVSGTYRISGGTIYLTSDSGAEEELTFSKSGKTIYIAEMEYIKK